MQSFIVTSVLKWILCGAPQPVALPLSSRIGAITLRRGAVHVLRCHRVCFHRHVFLAFCAIDGLERHQNELM